MKKLLSMLICLLVSSVLVLSVSAAASAKMSLKSSAATVHRGNTFTLTVSLKNDQPVSEGGVVLSYDSAVFAVLGGSCKVPNAASGSVSAEKNGGEFILGTETVVSGTIFSIQMQVKEDAPFGSYSISGTASLSVSCTLSGAKVTVACQHDYQNHRELDEDEHQSVCTVCADKKTEDHTWDKGEVITKPTCQEPGWREVTCTVCEATTMKSISTVAHECTYENLQTEGHRYTCKKCGETGTETHSYGEGWKHDADSHYRTCEECGNQRDKTEHVPGSPATEDSNQICTVCHRVLQLSMNHDHTFSEEWVADETSHWYKCAECDATRDMENHEYDNDCDEDCNICTATRQPPHNFGDWQMDEGFHWQACSVCGQKAEYAEHSPSEQNPASCNVCAITLVTDHTHNFVSAHTHLCECGESQSGTAQFCKVCGTFPWWVLCVAEAALFAGILLVVIQKRKLTDESEEVEEEKSDVPFEK